MIWNCPAITEYFLRATSRWGQTTMWECEERKGGGKKVTKKKIFIKLEVQIRNWNLDLWQRPVFTKDLAGCYCKDLV